MIVENETLNQYESRYRYIFINLLAGIRQLVFIGIKLKDQFSNLAVLNSPIHIGVNPQSWGLKYRPDVAKRSTLNNILETNYYTFNNVSTDDFKNTHPTSSKYDKSVLEFYARVYSEIYQPTLEAPFSAQTPKNAAMKLKQKIDVTFNNTILIIGSIQFIKISEKNISGDGFNSLDTANILASARLGV